MSRRARARVAAALLASITAGSTVGRAQTACPDVTSLRVSPVTPRAGSLFRVWAKTGGATPPHVTVAGEPLHFHAVGDSSVAMAAVPIDSFAGVTLTTACAGAAPATRRIATRAGEYKLERLNVAPQFSAKPDSALEARQQREAEQAAAVSRASHDTPRLWTSPFAVPRATRITSPFGGGRTFNGTVTSRHMGTDYAGALGTPVRASNRGVVRLLGAFYLGGNVIYIDHGEGVVTAYLHLSKQLVAVGDTVEKGAIIGRVGATGRVTGPHLHFIARYGEVTVDPASLFALR